MVCSTILLGCNYGNVLEDSLRYFKKTGYRELVQAIDTELLFFDECGFLEQEDERCEVER